ncbi:ubiquitin-conjugating enzyme [Microdochium trichocladiopsis]|uniref:E2 ubiquitin-conjugating enzyme n=1 Tax=Microdochium trichocladiopsis TaxID=1682393 RepID=A0A9P8YGR4_9PEZI|nr:ubiquitin-conjugating enzyme [Microdochium trichocladiopsis]KAH7039633.1 ubiquitin-conjugating enzyme [Microdochium trichocladiopsis]
MSSQKRINKELAECTESPPDGVTVALANDTDVHQWTATLAGPPGSAYEGGTFTLKIVLPREYPFKAPQVSFQTRIYHPNVTNDELGSICLSVLKSENWKPASRIKGVLESVRQLLVEPNPDDPLEARIADEYRSQRDEFVKNARQYVERYAKA